LSHFGELLLILKDFLASFLKKFATLEPLTQERSEQNHVDQLSSRFGSLERLQMSSLILKVLANPGA
jgi:hypothetical protein